MNPMLIELLVAVVELGAELGPHIAEAIRSEGKLDDAKRAELRQRVMVARAKVAAYQPRDL
jgi:hypothetical protein